MKGIIEKLFNGIGTGRRSGGFSYGSTTPLQTLPTRPYSALVAIGKQHGTAFIAAMEGDLNAEEYMKLDNGVDDGL